MTTETSPLNRQPTALDYSSPTQFRFLINQLPKVQYFTTEANLPGITLDELELGSPLKDLPLLGSKLTYDDLTITFIVDENLENYIEMHTWLTGIGFPKDRKQFSDFRSVTSNMSVKTRGESNDIGDVRASTPELAMTSDSVMTILTNKNNHMIDPNDPCFSMVFLFSYDCLELFHQLFKEYYEKQTINEDIYSNILNVIENM